MLSTHAAQRKDNIPADTLSFEIKSDNRIYVKAFVNDSEKPFTFLLDTGASDIVLNASVPEVMATAVFSGHLTNTGATSSEEVPATDDGQSIRAGRSKVEGLRFIAIPYPPEAYDGVLGLSFLKNFDVTINYDRKEIYLNPGGSACSGRRNGIKFSYMAGVPVIPVEVTINGRAYSLNVELDSGSDRALDINTPYVKAHGLRGSLPVFAISTISGTSSENGCLENVCFDNLRIGNVDFPLLPGAFSTLSQGLQATDIFDGVIGNNLLQRFNQTWDFVNRTVYLSVNNRYYKPFYDFLITQ